MAIYDRVCRTCGRSFKGGPRAWYCPDCREERRKERNAKYRKGKPKRPLGSKDICQNCGNEYTVESGLQKYCPDCQPEMHKKVDNEQGIAYYKAIVSKDKKSRNDKRRKKYTENKDDINAKRREKYTKQAEPNITIKELRTKAKMTQAKFAAYFHIPISNIGRWETKNRQPPNYLIELIEYKLLNEKIIENSIEKENTHED